MFENFPVPGLALPVENSLVVRYTLTELGEKLSPLMEVCARFVHVVPSAEVSQ